MPLLLQAAERGTEGLSPCLRTQDVRREGGAGAALQTQRDSRPRKAGGTGADHADRRAGEAVARREPGRKERARPLHNRRSVGTLHSETTDRRLPCTARTGGPDDAHGGGGEDSRRAPLAHSLCRRRAVLHNTAHRPRTRRIEDCDGGHVPAHGASHRVQVQGLVRADCETHKEVFGSAAARPRELLGGGGVLMDYGQL